jgi:DNA-directed RNA polymerase specialized sigma24 family protein
MWSTQSAEAAKDLVQDAFLRLLDVEDLPWTQGSFTTHMSFAMRDTWKEWLRRRSNQEVPDAGVTEGALSFARGAPADMQLHYHRTLAVMRMLGERLVDRIRDKHPLAVRVFDLAAEGVETAAEQARILACPIEDVYEADRVLKYHGQIVKDEWELSEEKRMAQLRAKYQEEKRRKDEEDRR